MLLQLQSAQAQIATVAFPDICIIYPRTYAADAAAGAVPADGAGVTLACSIGRASAKSMNARLVDDMNLGTVEGRTQFILRFPADPGVVAADQRIEVTRDTTGAALARRPLLMSIAAASWPSGGDLDWTVYAAWDDATA
jgi:hypothetical protein